MNRKTFGSGYGSTPLEKIGPHQTMTSISIPQTSSRRNFQRREQPRNPAQLPRAAISLEEIPERDRARHNAQRAAARISHPREKHCRLSARSARCSFNAAAPNSLHTRAKRVSIRSYENRPQPPAKAARRPPLQVFFSTIVHKSAPHTPRLQTLKEPNVAIPRRPSLRSSSPNSP